MRILHLIPSLSGGGAERQLFYLAREQARLGHDVHIGFTSTASPPFQLPGVHLHPLSCSSNYDPMLMLHLWKLIHRVQPEILQTWILQMDILGGIISRFSRVAWLLREPSSEAGYSGDWKCRLRVFLAGGAEAVVCNSLGGSAYWAKVCPAIPRYRIVNSVPLDEIEAVPAGFPSGLQEERGAPLLLAVGRLNADRSGDKNLESLLEAIAVTESRRPVQVLVCGEGPQRQGLESLSRQLGLEGQVRFPGFLPAQSIWGLMKRADAYISLSAFEGCPNTVLEAMACGCPLILSDIPAHRELVDETGALFVDPLDRDAVSRAIAFTMENFETARLRAEIARKNAIMWSIDRMALAYDDVYGHIVAPGG